jgi:hypothetical protein
MPQINLPADELSYYMLAFQGNSHVYEFVNLKQALSEALLEEDATELKSFIHSTIIFKGPSDRASFNRFVQAIENVCQQYEPRIYFELVVSAGYTTGLKAVYVEGDERLNEHYQGVLAAL